MKHTLIAACALAAAFACQSPHAADVQHGRGLISFDREPPAGAESVDRPTWKAGDRYTFVRGGKVRAGFTAASREGGFELVEDDTGMALELDGNFGELGEKPRGSQALSVSNDPVDTRFCWPLWVGKRWTSNFVVHGERGAPVPLFAHYKVDAVESVTVPAGTFRCWRIWRTTQLAKEGNFIDLTALLWYAPDAGIVVKRLDDGIVTELASFQRQ